MSIELFVREVLHKYFIQDSKIDIEFIACWLEAQIVILIHLTYLRLVLRLQLREGDMRNCIEGTLLVCIFVLIFSSCLISI